MNFRKITLVTALCFISVSEVLSLSLGQMFWNLKVSELKNLGVSIRAYKNNSMCGGTAHELWISIPDKFHKNNFVGVALTLLENEELYLDINLTVESLVETLYSKEPFHGAVFCLSERKWKHANLTLMHGPPGHITDLIEIKGISKLVEIDDS